MSITEQLESIFIGYDSQLDYETSMDILHNDREFNENLIKLLKRSSNERNKTVEKD